MKIPSRGVLYYWVFVLVVIAFSCGLTRKTEAYTTESPKVKQLVAKAVKHLERSNHDKLGGDCLIALALLKAGKDVRHPKITSAITRCIKEVKSNSVELDAKYSLGIAIIFLCEVGPQQHKSEIETLIGLLLKHQQPGGAWGYASGIGGDTSQTQYGVLALWAASRANIQVPKESAVRVLEWLMRTQDPGGGWTYVGGDPGRGNYNRSKQGDITLSISAAGLGSVYICADLLGINSGEKAEEENDNLPPALEPVGKKKKKKKPKPTYGALKGLVNRTTNDGNRWFGRNYKINQQEWGHYYRYALERYQSFRELAENIDDEEPEWYNDGVEYLAKTQKSDGSWSGGDEASTAFAVLFLTRSTKKTIGKVVLGSGTMKSGRGLPSDTTNVRIEGDRVVGPSLAKSLKDLLAAVENGDGAKLDELLNAPGQFKFDATLDPREKPAQLLRDLVSKNKNYKARMVAVRALAKSRNTQNVPVLIYALSDPDPRVIKEARDSLRFMARKFNGFGIPDKPSPAQRDVGIKAWKNWYLSIRPDAKFLD